MNLFILDEDHDKNAEYHIDKHIGKMQLEAAQILSTTLWIDREFGYIPRKLDSDELAHIKTIARNEPNIDERIFLRYLPAHHNHPCTLWCRESLENYYWTHCYVNALNSESIWRGNKPHASCIEVNKMPEPKHLPCVGLTEFALAMPDELKSNNTVESYRNYYKRDKAIIATWKLRGEPYWWTDTTKKTL